MFFRHFASMFALTMRVEFDFFLYISLFLFTTKQRSSERWKNYQIQTNYANYIFYNPLLLGSAAQPSVDSLTRNCCVIFAGE